MSFTITDQRPAVYDPHHLISIAGAYNPIQAIREKLVDPLFEPLPGRTVSILDDHGQPVDEDDVLDLFTRALSGQIDQDAENALHDLFSQGLVHYDPQSKLHATGIFTVQAAAEYGLPAPSPRVHYSAAQNVSPAAKALLTNANHDNEIGFFSNLAYTFSPETLGFWFLTESAYEDFRDWFDQRINTLTPLLPLETTQLLQKFQQLKLSGLTESLILRKDDSDELQDYSFARVLVYLLTEYSHLQRNPHGQPAATTFEVGMLPFAATELFLPRTVVIVNVEAHARSSARKINAEWKLINTALNSPVKVMSTKNLSKLTALPRSLAKAASQAANARSNTLAKMGRSARVKFRKQPPSQVDLLSGVTRVFKRMKAVNRSQNTFKAVKTSFVKANRRDPDDFNKPGKLTSTRYLPDLHVYIDTSGSISELNYQEAMIMLITLAKKLNINIYFNSFSHVLSQSVMLKTANKSVNRIWQEFQRIPKVNGGTDYEQIWHYINASPERQRRFSLVITDFEWRARSQRIDHPKNLYYAPCGHMDWDRMIYHAKGFTNSVQHNEPAITQRLIGIVA